MFTLLFTNFSGILPEQTFGSLEDAKSAGRKAGFEFQILRAGRLVLSWTVFGGYRDWE